MKTLVSGPSWWTDYFKMVQHLQRSRNVPDKCLISLGHPKEHKMWEYWAEKQGLDIVKTRSLRKAIGGAQAAIIFHDNLRGGTEDLIIQAIKANLPVEIIYIKKGALPPPQSCETSL